ncbi:DNA polymerase-3 subunit epsilon [Frondihabitans sp. PhB188]|uniref:exonuclease domain-containing protein n=1 Tax=Frondihabitans sp. PhB188 TaxID=2485200 RepID=UPI000F4977BE|nr:exonuclease domain-containing protein [Frondihabitans sp. PhB188]ROQ40740.1 DNA polymerase-3 subunit epsilon [Frondihabitans sp. PhB188]
MTHGGYAVIDFETTGLWPAKHDRVVEIGVVLVSASGAVEGEFETVVNPGRDLGPTHIHRLRGADVADAPVFADVVGEFLDLLVGRVVVAHNARFEVDFLRAELALVGLASPLDTGDALCTMKLATRYLPGSGRRLADCCAAFDIELTDAHEALADARATARLLAEYLRVGAGDAGHWDEWGERAKFLRWPITSWPGSPAKARPRTAALAGALTPVRSLEQAATRLPALDTTHGESQYAAMLDQALSDGYLSLDEADALRDLALKLGIDAVRRRVLHEDYFRALVDAVWMDGILTSDERAELDSVARMLDISNEMQQAALVPPAPGGFGATLNRTDNVELNPGDVVVLTGDMWLPRGEIEKRLAAHGIVVWPAITKKTALLIAADPTSLSGKARRARDYGIPVAAEEDLKRVLA